jgi:GntR family transcriptional regulator, sialic acid-inducible nan operon repressor
MTFKNVKRRKVHEDVAAQIEEAIVSGSLAEGENLPSERDLMESFNVGRPAVREALLLLERTGLVQLTTGGRARIIRPTVSVLVNQLAGTAKHFLATPGGEESFQDARRLFEAAIARNAAEIATDHEIAELRKALEANRAALDDMAAFERTDVAFHFALASIGDNPVFAALHGGIAGWLSKQRHISLRVAGAAKRALKSHDAIFEAVATHQPEEAWRAMDDHLRDVMKLYRKSSGKP